MTPVTGVPGNFATLFVARQTALGTPNNTPAASNFKLKHASNAGLDAARGFVELVETDQNRQQGDVVVVSEDVAGSPDVYCRPDDIGLLMYGVLGANADSGTTDPYTHTATPATAPPWFTFIEAYNSTVLVDQFSDCLIESTSIKGQAGGVITCTIDVLGASMLFNQTDPVKTTVTQTPFVWPNITVTKGGVAPAQCESFQLDIKNNAQIVRTDVGILPGAIVPAKLTVSGTMTLLFQNANDYYQFHTGSSGGTAPAATLFAQSLSIAASTGATPARSCTWTMNSVAYRAYPVNPDPAGGPIKVAVAFYSRPNPGTPANYIQAVTVNGISSY